MKHFSLVFVCLLTVSLNSLAQTQRCHDSCDLSRARITNETSKVGSAGSTALSGVTIV